MCVSLYLHNCLCTAVHPTSRSCFSSAPHLPQHALVYFVSLPSSHLPAAGLVVDVSFLMLTSSLTTHYLCGKCVSSRIFKPFFFGQPHLSVLCNFEECAEAPGILVFLAFESSFGSHFRCSLPPCHLREHWHAQGGGTVHDPLSLLSRIASSHLDYLLPPPISYHPDPTSYHPPRWCQ